MNSQQKAQMIVQLAKTFQEGCLHTCDAEPPHPPYQCIYCSQHFLMQVNKVLESETATTPGLEVITMTPYAKDAPQRLKGIRE